ncbi:hypothetical protein KCP71_20675 [Salmonella enterica subsp. enterica]|nr:hypothetical protein KCP71_20675 [Salmonella enterica subsp. enterica]
MCSSIPAYRPTRRRRSASANELHRLVNTCFWTFSPVRLFAIVGIVTPMISGWSASTCQQASLQHRGQYHRAVQGVEVS